jgi:phage major head subunit gpT-like protein
MPGMAGVTQGTIVDDALLQDAAVTFDATFASGYDGADEEARIFESFTTLIGARSKKVRFPIAGLLPAMRKWVGERVAHKLNRYAMEAEIETYEETVEVDVDELDDDTIGSYTPHFTELGRQARLWPRDLVVAKLMAGESELCFDGQNFFDTDHPVDPSNAGAGTYSNLLSGGSTAFAETGLQNAITAMRMIKGPDGRPMRAKSDTLIIPPQLELAARKLLNLQTLTTGGENAMAGVIKNIIVLDELTDPAEWYLAATKGALKPLLFMLRQAPIVTSLDKADSPNVFHHNKAIYGAKARGAAAVGLPFLIIKNNGS